MCRAASVAARRPGAAAAARTRRGRARPGDQYDGNDNENDHKFHNSPSLPDARSEGAPPASPAAERDGQPSRGASGRPARRVRADPRAARDAGPAALPMTRGAARESCPAPLASIPGEVITLTRGTPSGQRLAGVTWNATALRRATNRPQSTRRTDRPSAAGNPRARAPRRRRYPDSRVKDPAGASVASRLVETWASRPGQRGRRRRNAGSASLPGIRLRRFPARAAAG